MDKMHCGGADAARAFSCCPSRRAGELQGTSGGKSFVDVLAAMRTATAEPLAGEGAGLGGAGLFPLLPGFSSALAAEPEAAKDSGAYLRHLQTKFGMRVTVRDFDKDQKSMDALGRGMGGNDLVIAPNILEEMATNRDKAAYYEAKIACWFDSIPKWKAEAAAMGLTYEPCGMAIHEDGTVYYIGGGTETPERKAQIEAAQKAKREKKFRLRQEQQAYIARLLRQKQADALASNWARFPSSSIPTIVTTKRFMPDGSIVITTRKDGKVVDRTTKKPRLVPVPDPTAEGGVRMEPMQDIFELLMM